MCKSHEKAFINVFAYVKMHIRATITNYMEGKYVSSNPTHYGKTR